MRAILVCGMAVLMACGCEQRAANETPAPKTEVVVNPAGPPVIVDATLRDETPERVRTRRMAELERLRDDWFQARNRFAAWEEGRQRAHDHAVESAELAIAKARAAATQKLTSMKPLQDALAERNKSFNEARRLAESAKAATESGHVQFAADAVVHLARIGKFNELLDAHRVARDSVGLAQDEQDAARDAWRTLYDGIYGTGDTPTAEQEAALTQARERHQTATDELAKAISASDAAESALEDWRKQVTRWSESPTPTHPKDPDTSKAVESAAIAHRAALSGFLTQWGKRTAAIATLQSTSKAYDADSLVSEIADDAFTESKKKHRAAALYYDRVVDKVKADESARAMGSNVQPDYNGLYAAKRALDTAKVTMDRAEKAKKDARAKKSESFKAKKVAATTLSAVEKRVGLERTSLKASCEALSAATAPWVKELTDAEASLQTAVDAQDAAEAALQDAMDTVRRAEDELSILQGELDAAVSRRAGIGYFHPTPDAGAFQRYIEAVNAVMGSRIEGSAVREFRTLKITLPVWPEADQTRKIFEQIWYAVTESIDGSRQ